MVHLDRRVRVDALVAVAVQLDDSFLEQLRRKLVSRVRKQRVRVCVDRQVVVDLDQSLRAVEPHFDAVCAGRVVDRSVVFVRKYQAADRRLVELAVVVANRYDRAGQRHRRLEFAHDDFGRLELAFDDDRVLGDVRDAFEAVADSRRQGLEHGSSLAALHVVGFVKLVLCVFARVPDRHDVGVDFGAFVKYFFLALDGFFERQHQRLRYRVDVDVHGFVRACACRLVVVQRFVVVHNRVVFDEGFALVGFDALAVVDVVAVVAVGVELVLGRLVLISGWSTALTAGLS